MQTLLRAITRPNDPPRVGDRLATKALSFIRAKVARRSGKRLASPAQLQALRDKHAKQAQKKA